MEGSKEIYEAARAAVCIGRMWTKWDGDIGRWEDHIPVKRHCCCDGRCGLAADDEPAVQSVSV